MAFKRVWDSTCPRIWDSWESDGKTFIVQDLAPEDDQRATEILLRQLVPDETLCSVTNLSKDPVSMRSVKEMWTQKLAQRMSLGCYVVVDGKKTLVALNACYVSCDGDKTDFKVEGESWKNVYAMIEYTKKRCNSFKYLGVDKVLSALGLVVVREYRGAGLGGRILTAREPLCTSQGIKATETIFTGPASQKLAARCGFETILEVTLQEIADSGVNICGDDRVIKVMIKKYE